MDVSVLRKTITHAQHLDWPSVLNIVETKSIQHGNRQAHIKGLYNESTKINNKIGDGEEFQYPTEDSPYVAGGLRADDERISVLGPPVFEEREGRWKIAQYVNNHDLCLYVVCEKDEVVVESCVCCRLVVKGTFHNLTVNNCTDCTIVVDDITNNCRVAGCQNVRVEPHGRITLISILTKPYNI